MNNRDWLYTMQPRDLARWFDAEHVEPNDNLSPEKGVSEGKADANDAKKVSATPLNVPNVIKWQYMDGSEHVQEFAQDSREKLLYDASELVADCAPSGGDCDPMYRAIVELLDRQAAITERGLHGKIRTMQKQNEEHLRLIDDLTAERDEWRKRALQAESKGSNQRLNSLRNTLRRDWHTETVWQDAQSVYRLRVDPDVLHPIPNFTRNEVYRSSMLERDEIIGDLTEENERLAEKARRIDETDSRWEYMRRDLERITAERDALRAELDKWEKLADGIELPEHPVTQFAPREAFPESTTKDPVKRLKRCVRKGRAHAYGSGKEFYDAFGAAIEYTREQFLKLAAECDMWRDKCGQMLDAAHELARIAEVSE